jgi:hypothetical protein
MSKTFSAGFRLGVALVLLMWVLWDCLVDDDMGKDVWHDPAFKVYRGLGNLVLLLLCWGVDVHVWRRAGIDYERFLRLPPTPPGSDPTVAIWNEGLDLAIALLLSLICFWKALRGVFLQGVPPQLAHGFPLTLFLYIMYRAVTPWETRKLLYTSVWEVLEAPWGRTAFKEGFAGDVLTSTVRVIVDLTFSVLYFLSGVKGWFAVSEELDPTRDVIENSTLFARVLVPLITVLPLWLRFLQNLQRSYDTRERWPHLGNAMKYATAQTVALYGLHHRDAKNNVLWIFGFVFATLYQFIWDIFMDWDLVRISKRSAAEANDKHRHGSSAFFGSWSIRFREPLLYRSKSFYCLVALLNFLLRFFWTLTLIPEGGQEAWQKTIQVRLSPVLAAAEICRRCMWAFLRLENEHLHMYGTALDEGFATLDEAEAMALDPRSMTPMQIGAALNGASSAGGGESRDGGKGVSNKVEGAGDKKDIHENNSGVKTSDREVAGDSDDSDDDGEASMLHTRSSSGPAAMTNSSLNLGFVVIRSSTASLTSTAVAFELTVLAVFMLGVGAFVAFCV